MIQGNAVARTATESQSTLNDRLNKISEGLQYHCERIESLLARVHGNPQAPKPTASDVSRINPTLPMVTVVEHLEAVQARLADLATHAERIA